MNRSCHPERSKLIREANQLAQSKDPFSARITIGPTGTSTSTLDFFL
jgi:hypothetical protein